MGMQYSVTFINHSGKSGDFCLYQTMPHHVPNVMSLAWQSKTVHPGTNLDIDWSIEYGAVWNETGKLSPGVRFKASEIREVNIKKEKENSVMLSLYEGAYGFIDAEKTAPAGNIGLYTDDSIPNGSVSVGVSMSGKSAFAAMAQPNWSLILSPHPVYWAVFGDFKEGVVLDVTNMSNIVEVKFPVNVYHVDLELDEANQWNAKNLLQSNRHFLEQHRKA